MATLIVTNIAMEPVLQVPLAGRRKVTIGRSPQRDLILNDPRISRLHCVLCHECDVWCMVDAGSRGGTFVDDKRVQWKRMREGRVAAVGDFRLYVSPVALPPIAHVTGETYAGESWDLAGTQGLDETMCPSESLAKPVGYELPAPPPPPSMPNRHAAPPAAGTSAFLTGPGDFIPLAEEGEIDDWAD